MTAQNPLEPPQQTPLDAERAKLRAAGYTPDEISKILIARAVAPAQATSGGSSGVVGQQGMLSGALNNFNTALKTVQNALPNALLDLQNIFAAGVAPATRMKAASSLAIKALLVMVVGYAIAQEWQIHIINAPKTAAAQAEQEQAKAAVAAAVAAGEKAKAEGFSARYQSPEMGLPRIPDMDKIAPAAPNIVPLKPDGSIDIMAIPRKPKGIDIMAIPHLAPPSLQAEIARNKRRDELHAKIEAGQATEAETQEYKRNLCETRKARGRGDSEICAAATPEKVP